MGRIYRNYTKEHVANAIAAVNSSISKKLAATTFEIPLNYIGSKCLGKHIKSEGHPAIVIHEVEQLIPKSLGVVYLVFTCIFP